MIKIHGRLWISAGKDALIGNGRIDLLEKTGELGSLRKAAVAMKMSYRQAWLSIHDMNTQAPKPLVNLKRGGKEGGIAELTDAGLKLIRQFRKLQADFDAFLVEKSRTFKM